MFFALSKTLDLLVSPLFWALSLFALAVPWRLRRPPSPERSRLLGGLGIAVLLVFASAPMEAALVRATERSARSTMRPGQVYDAVIVLGGIVEHDRRQGGGTVGYGDAVERLLAGYDLLRTGRARYAIVTGAPLGEHPGDAGVMRDQLVAWGIPEERILLADRSLNTHGDAVGVRALAEEHRLTSLLVVTSAFHALRAEECFHAEGMRVDMLPVDYRMAPWGLGLLPRAGHLDGSTLMLRELFGRVVYRARGYAKPIPR